MQLVTKCKIVPPLILIDCMKIDLRHRIQADCENGEMHQGSCILNMPLKLKGTFYRTAIKPALLH